MTRPADPTFLAPPGQVADWRRVLLCDVAAGTGLLEALPGTPEVLAERLELDAHALRVLLDALTVYQVVSGDADGTYVRGAEVPTDSTLAGLRHHARALRRWAAALEDRTRDRPISSATGPADPEAFHDALAVTARQAAPGVVDACLTRFPHARSVLDLGGLHGEYSLEFTRRGLAATMQDQPVMVEVARRRGRLEAAGVQLFAGSFFDTVPEGPFDLAFCSGITHTFDGDHNLALFGNLRRVLVPSGAGVAVVTFLRGRHPVSALFAVQMLLNANGGDTHTEAEYRQWLGDSGFTADPAVVDLPDQAARSVLFAS
ncbi:MAG: class I SAM-dependent methyltransferase [Mycobacteriales bacterium]